MLIDGRLFGPRAAGAGSPPTEGVLVNENWKGLGTYGTVGIEFALSVLLGLFVGNWIDRKLFGDHGWATFIGFGFGLAAGGRAIWRALQAANRDAERQERREREERKKFDEKDPNDR